MNFKHYLVVASVCLLTLGVFPASPSAQQQYGELVVRVLDQTGAVVTGATVELTSPALIRPVEGNTDFKGIYRVPTLPSGLYKITVRESGFATSVQEDVKVQVGRTFRVDITLEVGTVEEVVMVEGAPVIDVVKSESAAVWKGNDLTNAPGGRDYTDYSRYIPSVNIETQSGVALAESINGSTLQGHKGRSVAGVSVDGSSGAENVFYVDGVDTTSMYNGLPNQGIRTETVQELQVKTAGYEAEFGGAMGGVVSVVTKSGSNDIHGQLLYYYSGDALTSNSRKRLRLDPSQAVDVAEYVQDPEDDANEHEFGFTLGGPIVRDKAWFFGALMPQWTSRTRDVQFTSGESGVFNSDRTIYNGTLKLDYQPLRKLRLGASAATDWFKREGALPNFDGTDNPGFAWADEGFKYPSYTFTTSATATLTPNFLVDVRWGLNAFSVEQFLEPPGVRHRFIQSNGLIGFTPDDPLYRARGFATQSHSASFFTDQDFQRKTHFSAGASWLTSAGGQHNIKFGYQFNRLFQALNNAYRFDYIRYYYGQVYTTTDGRDVTSTCTGPDGVLYDPCGYYEGRYPFGEVARIHTDRQAFYIQDAWTIAGRLTVNAGLRFEKEAIPSFSDLPEFAGSAFKWGFGDKVAPRLGAAFDVFGNRKLKIYGSWGWFYDAMKLEMANGSFGGFKWISTYYLLDDDNLNWTQIGGLNGAGPYPGQRIESRNWRIPSFETLDPDLKPMRMTEIVAGMEWEVSPSYFFSFRYVRKNLDEAIEDVGVQTPQGETYYITNPGRGFSVSKFLEAGLPATPNPQRTYNAWEFRLRKEFTDNWLADISYTYSRLRGLYSGLGSSDENGRLSPNVDRDFDLWFLNYDSNGNFIDGPLGTDRPHQLKINGNYDLPFGFTVGGFFRVMSGTPISRTADLEFIDILVDNRGSDGRNPTWNQTDLYLIQRFHPFQDENKTIEFNVNIINLFNQKKALRSFRSMNREVLSLWSPGDPVENVLGGYDVKAIMAAEGVDLDPRFLQHDRFQERMAVRLGVKFIF